MAEAIAEYMRHHKAQMLTNILILIKKSIFISMNSDLISTLAQARKAARITQADLAARAAEVARGGYREEHLELAQSHIHALKS